MINKIIIHTDASNIKNSNICKTASIIDYNSKISTITNYFSGKINQAELITVLRTLEQVEKDYNPVNFNITVYTDHLPNANLLNKIIAVNIEKSDEILEKINSILKRKCLTHEDISVISRLQNNNILEIIWISRKENKMADRLCKMDPIN